MSSRLRQGGIPHTFDEILQDIQACRLAAGVTVYEVGTTLQAHAASLVEVLVFRRACERTVNWIEMLVEALAPE